MKRRLSLFMITLICICAPLWSVDEEGELFGKAAESFREERFAFTLEILDDFMRLYPRSDRLPDVQYYRAVSLFQLTRYEEAGDLFEAIARKYRSTRYLPYVAYWDGMTRYALGEPEGAVLSLLAFLEDTEENLYTPRALLYLGRSYIEAGRSADAAAYLERLLASHRESGEYVHAAALYAYVLLEEGRNAEAEGFLAKENWQQWPSPWLETAGLYMAEALWRQNYRGQAENIYWTLLDMPQELSTVAQQRLFLAALSSDNVAVMRDMMNRAEREFPIGLLKGFWFGIGVGSYRTGNLEVAEEFLQKVWDLRNSEDMDPLVPVLLARILWEKGETQGAVSILEDFRELQDDPGIALKRLGDYYRLEGDYEEAGAVYEAYLEQYPRSIYYGEAGYHLAFTHYRRGDLPAALEWINRLVSGDTSSEYTRDILGLRIELLKRMGRLQEALRALEAYVALFPDDIERRLDVLRTHFRLGDFAALVDESRKMKEAFPDLAESDQNAYFLLLYLEGMGYISGRSYRSALGNFEKINAAGDLGKLREIEPYSRYYEGWALYKLGNLEKAGPHFSSFAEANPGHELYTQALYLSGWSYYSSGNYEQSLAVFTTLAEYEQGSYAIQAAFLAGKSYRSLGEIEAARQIFRSLYKGFPESSLADDALYEFAGIEAEEGRVESAAESYRSLADAYSESPLSEEALFRRGRLYLNNGRSEEARDAFYDYRLHFPEGSLVDASLYWSGIASRNLNEQFGAVLYWEIIIRDYPESPFRVDALEKTAEVYRQGRKYQEAKELLAELTSSYPQEAEQKDIEKSIREIDFLIAGLSERAAELSVVIEVEGETTGRGRNAILEYVNMLLEEPLLRVDVAEPLLERVLEAKDPPTSMEAQFLIGELAFRQGSYVEAANAFLKAALIHPENGDLAAFSLFRAAEMLAWEGRQKEVAELIERLEKNFPLSQWVAEGERLLEEME